MAVDLRSARSLKPHSVAAVRRQGIRPGWGRLAQARLVRPGAFPQSGLHEPGHLSPRTSRPAPSGGRPMSHSPARDRPAERDAGRHHRCRLCGPSMRRSNFTAQGLDCIVLDANEPGFGGSTRNGGMVSGGVNVGKRYMAKAMSAEEAAPFLQRCGRCLQPTSRTSSRARRSTAAGPGPAISSAPGARATTTAWPRRSTC